jgi:CubicO group peptidase (beta-lactamase class C family)
MLKRIVICTVLLLVVHAVAKANVTLEQMEAEGGIPALVAVYLQAFNTEDEPGMRSFLGRHRDEESLSRTPLDSRVSRQQQMRGMLGPLTPVQVQRSTRTDYELVVFSEATGTWFLLSFQASEFDPIRFGMMGLRPTEDPADPAPPIEGPLAEVVAAQREARGLPALSVAVVDPDGSSTVVVDGVRSLENQVSVEPDDLFHYGSITKTVTACVAARLVDAGSLSFETTLEDGLTGVWLHSGFEPVTLEQLLQHRAGVETLLEDDPAREKNWAKEGSSPTEQRRAMAAGLLSVPPDPLPGAAMNYSNGGYGVVGLLIDQASGSAWEELVLREVAGPLGLSSWGIGWPATADRPDQPRGHWPGGSVQQFGAYALPAYLAPAGDVHGTVEDLARFGHALATGPDGWLQPSTRERLLTAAGDDPRDGYAMGLMREEMAERAVALHNGSAGTFFAVLVFVPGSGESIAVVTNEGNFANDLLARRLAEAILDGSVSVDR